MNSSYLIRKLAHMTSPEFAGQSAARLGVSTVDTLAMTDYEWAVQFFISLHAQGGEARSVVDFWTDTLESDPEIVHRLCCDERVPTEVRSVAAAALSHISPERFLDLVADKSVPADAKFSQNEEINLQFLNEVVEFLSREPLIASNALSRVLHQQPREGDLSRFVLLAPRMGEAAVKVMRDNPDYDWGFLEDGPRDPESWYEKLWSDLDDWAGRNGLTPVVNYSPGRAPSFSLRNVRLRSHVVSIDDWVSYFEKYDLKEPRLAVKVYHLWGNPKGFRRLLKVAPEGTRWRLTGLPQFRRYVPGDAQDLLDLMCELLQTPGHGGFDTDSLLKVIDGMAREYSYAEVVARVTPYWYSKLVLHSHTPQIYKEPVERWAFAEIWNPARHGFLGNRMPCVQATIASNPSWLGDVVMHQESITTVLDLIDDDQVLVAFLEHSILRVCHMRDVRSHMLDGVVVPWMRGRGMTSEKHWESFLESADRLADFTIEDAVNFIIAAS